MGVLRLDGPCLEWQPAAHRGRLKLPGEPTRRVVAILGPEETTALLPRRQAAARWVGRQEDGVVELLQVTELHGRPAWVYAHREALGLGHFVGGMALPLSVCADIVARVAEILLALGPDGLRHPGPEPSDILVTAEGEVALISFTSPFPPSPALREPHGQTDSAALVYRLGILLAALICSNMPRGAADPAAHEAMVHRILVRAMGRPGEGLPVRLRDWLTGMLAWSPEDRPALSRLPEGLREVALTCDGPPLDQWAASRVPRLLAAVAARRDPARFDPYEPLDPARPEARPPLQIRPPGDSPTFTADDPTVETVRPQRPSLPPEPAVMPVMVGPPPEAARQQPSLPPGFLETRPPEAPSSRRLVSPLLVAALLLIALGLAFAAYLF